MELNTVTILAIVGICALVYLLYHVLYCVEIFFKRIRSLENRKEFTSADAADLKILRSSTYDIYERLTKLEQKEKKCKK